MSLENTQLLASPDSPDADAVAARPRKVSTESTIARNRREVIALDGLMFESGSPQDELTPETLQHQSGPDGMDSSVSVDDPGLDGTVQPELKPGDHTSHDVDSSTLADTSTANATDLKLDGTSQATASLPLSPTSSTSSSPSSPTDSPATPTESPARNQYPSPISRQQLQADLPRRSLSLSKRQSMFLGDHIVISDGSQSSSNSPGSNDDQEDMKEVQIETADPSHLFWVPFHLHPEIAPNEYNKLLSKHGSTSQTPDGILSPKKSVSRRRSVLSAQYNPEDDLDDQPSRPPQLSDESGSHDFLSGVFTLPLEQMGEPPLKTRTSLRRSVSLSVSSPTKAEFPADTLEEDLVAAKKSGLGGGLSLLRRSARTKLRRNSTASNDARTDLSRLRQTMNANGEHTAVSLVDHGPQPLPSAAQPLPSSAQPLPSSAQPLPSSAEQSTETTASTTEDQNKARKEGESVPVKRFVSTLRDPSKPTITTYIEPHLLEQQRRDNAEANKDGEEAAAPSFRISAPGKLESPIEITVPAESSGDRPDNYTVSYPIPPPVKMTQNLLQQPPGQQPSGQQPSGQQPSGQQPSPALPQSPSKQKQPGQTGPTHAKKPSTWSWLWGKEKGSEKLGDPSAANSNSTTAPSSQASKVNNSSQQPGNPETNTQASSTEVTVKKQSTLSMLFSRNGKSTSSKSNSSSDPTRSSSSNGFNGQGSGYEKPKYSNYNRFPIHVERAIYRLSHVKLANPRRPLQEQVLISNMMFWYLGVIQQQQVQQQQQAEMQQRQQQESQKDGNKGPEDGKEPKAKKPKKRKSQKKKNQVQHQHQQPQRGSSKAAEMFAKNLQQERQQQQQQQPPMNATPGQGVQPIQQGANLPSMSRAAERSGRQSSNQQIESDPSDSQEDSDGDESYLEQQQQQHTLAASSFNTEAESRQDDEEDDDVPLAHYQNMQRQTVSVS